MEAGLCVCLCRACSASSQTHTYRCTHRVKLKLLRHQHMLCLLIHIIISETIIHTLRCADIRVTQYDIQTLYLFWTHYEAEDILSAGDAEPLNRFDEHMRKAVTTHQTIHGQAVKLKVPLCCFLLVWNGFIEVFIAKQDGCSFFKFIFIISASRFAKHMSLYSFSHKCLKYILFSRREVLFSKNFNFKKNSYTQCNLMQTVWHILKFLCYSCYNSAAQELSFQQAGIFSANYLSPDDLCVN